jgi:hypothetical protein
MTEKKKQSFWFPVRILERSEHAGFALQVPSYVCSCLTGKRSPPLWLRSLLSKIPKFEKVFVDRANERWESLMGSLAMVAPVASLHKEEKNRVCLYRLFKWFIKSLVHSGQDWLDERLKAMFEYSRHLSGLPLPESSRPKVPSGTPGFEGQTFVGYPFFRGTPFGILNSVPKKLGWEVEAHWIFSTGKRSMGFPTVTKRIRSIEKFRSRSTQVLDPPQEVLESAKKFAYDYVNKFPDWKIRSNMNVHISYSSASCMEVGRNKGGRMRFIELRLQEFDELWWIFPRGKTIFGPSGDVFIDPLHEEWDIRLKDMGDGNSLLIASHARAFLGDQRILREISFAECSFDPSIPLELRTKPISECSSDSYDFFLFEEAPVYVTSDLFDGEILMRLDAVDDDGAKSRVIGVSQGALVNLSHLVRTLITSVIKCDREVPSMGWGNKKPDRTLGSEGIFDSADLTAATDCSSILEARSLAFGAVQCLLDRELVPRWLEGNIMALTDSLLRTQRVLAPPWWKSDGFPFSTLRSVPMGQPHSWVLLCLGQLFHRKRSLDVEPHAKGQRLTVCGDDTATSGGTLLQSLAYRASLKQSGYEVSTGTDIISNQVVQYTEQLWVRNEVNGKCVLSQVLSPFVKSLVSKNLSSRAPQKRGIREKMSHTGRGTAQTSATLSINLPFSTEDFTKLVRKVARIYSLYSNNGILERGKTLDIPVYLPAEFGGLGFSHPTGKNLAHTRTFFQRGVSSLISENRNIEYILAFRTLGSIWTDSPRNKVLQETKRLFESWTSSVFTSNRKVRGEHDLERSKDFSIWERPCWVDVIEISNYFGIELIPYDWNSYDKVKALLKEATGIKWFPIKETLDHVEASFRNEVLFRTDQIGGTEVPTLSFVSKRIHLFYKKRLESHPPPPSWRDIKNKSINEILDILHWRQNLVLVSEGIPRLENFSSRW